MVAIVSGNDLGILNASTNTQGFSKQGQLGQSGGQSYVNISNGNLVLRFEDEHLSGAGLDLKALRTYNSQGQANDGDQDQWRWDGERRVSLNTVNNTVTRTTGDGHVATYTWNGSTHRYESHEGDGAADFIVWNTTTNECTWTDGSELVSDTYNASGQLITQTDKSGNLVRFSYDPSGRLSSIEDNGNKQKLILTYADFPSETNSPNIRLQRVDSYSLVIDANGFPTLGAMVTEVTYDYDTFGRLIKVNTDLTPTNTTDNQIYSTQYAYDGDSLRISSVSQSDGTEASFTYEEGRVKTVSDSRGTQTFTYNTNSTSISNELGQVWIYQFDSSGQLAQVQSPAVNGQIISTSYQYDTKGNIILMTDGRGNSVTYGYDDSDNLILERDALGNTIKRTYNTNNQVLTETHYLTPDLDGDGELQPSNPLTTRYVYDVQNRLRFTVSAQGRVTEYQYVNMSLPGANVFNIKGVVGQVIKYTDQFYSISGLSEATPLNESQLASWTNSQNKQLNELTENQYDWRGNLKQVTQYARVDSAGKGILDTATVMTQYIYSEHGQLLKTIAKRGNTNADLTSVIYDGMGRQLSLITPVMRQTYVYDGSNKKISVTNSAGLTTSTAYDNTGRTISVTQTAVNETDRQTRYYYDQTGNLVMTQDAAGNNDYKFYDAIGRLQYTVDATGAVTENKYNENNQIITQINYSRIINTSSWFNDGVVVKSSLTADEILIDTANDRTTQYQYDKAGRLEAQTDSVGATTTLTYDGTSALIKRSSGSISEARTSRFFYDNDGKQVGALDGEGYLSENFYDAAGRLTKTIRYSTPTRLAFRASGTFAELKTGVGSADNLTSYFLYDSVGRVVGSVNEKGTLVETVYDNTNRFEYVKTYQTPIIVSKTDTLATLRVKAGIALTETTEFDKSGKISRKTAQDGTTTDYQYDSGGRITRALVARGQTELDGVTASQRATRYQYNAFNEVTGVVGGVGEATLASSPTAAAIKAAIESYGIQKNYDGLGRLTQTIDANGHKTFFYYDENNRVRFTVNAIGEVRENKYNTFGEISETKAYANRLTSLDGLNGGITTTDIITLFTALSDSANDRRVLSSYDQRGSLISQTDAEGFINTFGYNQFGEIQSETRAISSSSVVNTQYVYSKRGELTQTTRDSDIGGLNQKTKTVYDAFGRVKSVTDANDRTTSYSYANGGRSITVTNPLSHTQKSEYDVFGRTLSTTDNVGNVTTYSYDDSKRSVTVTTPEGIQLTTFKNRHGEALKVVDGRGGVTQYTYDKNGQVTQVVNELNQTVATNQYDNSGRLSDSIDANGVVTHVTYDEVDRVLTRTVDPVSVNNPTGLNIQTKYEFNAFGQTISVIEGVGSSSEQITQYSYDRKGQLTTSVTDPNGLKLQTCYTYDGTGNVLTVAKGTTATPDQFVTQYNFDKLGRRTSEIEAYGSLNLTTQYKYDANGNVTRKIDANGNSTWYVYDKINRQTHTINALGEVSEIHYNPAGQVDKTTQYATRIDTAGFISTDVLTTVTPIVNNTIDQVTENEYDKDGRLTQTKIDPNGLAITTQYRYDANNNLTRKIDANGNSTWYVYDKADRQVFSISALGQVSGTEYDALGRVSKTVQYATQVNTTSYLTVDVIDSFSPTSNSTTDQTTVNQYDNNNRLISTVVDPNGLKLKTQYFYDANNNVTRKIDANNNSTWYIYDKSDRQTYSINQLGEVTFTEYDAVGHTKQVTQYATRLSSATVNSFVNAVTSVATTSVASLDYVTSYQYDSNGRLINTIVDPIGSKLSTQYRYDANNNLTRKIDPAGNSTWYVYDKANRQTFSISALGEISETQYNAVGNVKTTFQYTTVLDTNPYINVDVVNSLTPTPNSGADRVTQYQYDKDNRLVQTIIDPGVLAISTQYSYDANDNLIRKIDANGNSTWYVYDKANRQVQTINALREVSETQYDNADRIVKTTRYATTARTSAVNESINRINFLTMPLDTAHDQINYFAYDKANRLRFSIDSIGAVTENTYPSNATGKIENTIKHSDALTAAQIALLQAAITNQSDTEVLLSPIVSTSGQLTTYQYDKAGRLTEETIDPNGLNIRTQYKYDALGRKSRQIDANGNSTWFIYNSAGELLQTVNALGEVTRYGNKNGYLIYTYKHITPIVTTSFANIDVLNSIVTTNIVNEDQWTLYSYDQVGRLRYESSKVDSNNYLVKENRYDAKGNLVATIAYDKYMSKSTMGDAFADNVLICREVETQLENNLGYSSSNYGGSQVTRYAYDANDRLRFTINAAGYVSENIYDALGHVVNTKAHSTALTSSQLTALSQATNTETLIASYLSHTENNVRTGFAALKVTQPISLASIYVNAGESLNYSVWFKADSGTSVVLELRNFVSGFNISQTAIGNGSWQQIVLTSVVPSSQSLTVRLLVDTNKSAIFDDLYITGSQSGNLYKNNFESYFKPLTPTTSSIIYKYPEGTSYFYDKVGRLAQEVIDGGGLNITTNYKYDSLGNLAAKIDANGNTTRYVYDKANRKTHSINAYNELTATQYDVTGAVIRETRYATRQNNNLVYSYEDGINRIGIPSGNSKDQITTYAYDNAGRLTSSTVDPSGLMPLCTQYSYDGVGNVTRMIDPKGNKTWYIYDSIGQLTHTINALGQVTLNSYSTGLLLLTRQYAIAISTDEFGASVSSVTLFKDVADRVTYYTYDKVNRLRYTTQRVDSVNYIISENRYDAFGNVVANISYEKYATHTVLSVPTSDVRLTEIEVNAVIAGLGYTNNNYGNARVSRMVYDNNNRLRFSAQRADSTNYTLTENRYDAMGNVVETIGYDKYLASTTLATMLIDSRITESEMQTAIINLGYSSNNYGQARVTHMVYDNNNRLSFIVNAKGYVTKNIYDAFGNIIQTTAFANKPTFTAYSETAINSALVFDPTKDQTTEYFFDSVNRLRYTTDALNHRESYDYDAVGNMILKINKRGAEWNYVYDAANRMIEEISPSVSVASVNKDTNAVTWVDARLVTRNSYDLNGNLWIRTEGILRNGNVDDASQARTTTYEYDAANRQTKTILHGWYDSSSGSVEAAETSSRFQRTTEVTYDALGNAISNKVRSETGYIFATKMYDNLGRIVYEVDALNQVIQTTYDAFGNAMEVSYHDKNPSAGTKNTGTVLTSGNINSLIGTTKRTTNFQYDQLGRKIAELLPISNAIFYSSSADDAVNDQNNAIGFVARGAINYSYDAFGNLISTKTQLTDSEWATQWSVYNALNQKVQDAKEVETGKGYVTDYSYDAFGNVATTIEYAKKVAIPVDAPTEKLSATTDDNDRYSEFSYDALNRQTEIRGNLEFVARMHEELYTDWVIEAVGPLQTTTYDEVGNITSQSEQGRSATLTQYDALGRVTKITMPLRKTASASASGVNLDPFRNQVDASPTLQYRYNAFGQRVVETRGAGGGRGLAAGDVVLTTRYDAAGNIIKSQNATGNFTYSEYDIAGRVIHEYQDVSANFEGYTAGNWADGYYSHKIEKRFEYDILGRQTASYDFYTDAQKIKQKSGTLNEYNRFGEIVKENLAWGAADGSTFTTATIATNTYDNAGRLIAKANLFKSDDLVTSTTHNTTKYFYDLAGRKTRVEEQGNGIYTGIDETPNRVTEIAYDKLGNVLVERAPQFHAIINELTAGTDVVNPRTSQSYDRWGNVISRTDVTGSVYTYTYTYNRNNQLVRETSPETTVVSLVQEGGKPKVGQDGQYIFTTSTSTVIRELQYSSSGFMLRDIQKVVTGNDAPQTLRIRNYRYNEVGQLTSYEDGTGVKTRYAYDAFGNKIGTANGAGTVTVDSFDAAGNQLTHGVLRLSSTSSANDPTQYYRSSSTAAAPQTVILQSYAYDQAGRRTKVLQGNSQTSSSGYGWQFYRYDERNNVVQYRNELGTVVTKDEFDAQNHLIREEDAKGNFKTWQYDTQGRLLKHQSIGYEVIISGSDPTQIGQDTTYTYDDFGQQATQNNLALNGTNVDRATIYKYHENGLLKQTTENITEHFNGPTLSRTLTNNYDYDIAGHRVRELRSDSLGADYTIETRSYFDQLGRLAKFESLSGKLFYKLIGSGQATIFNTESTPTQEFQYDALGNRAIRKEAGIVRSKYLYDAEGRMTYQMEEKDFSVFHPERGDKQERSSPKLYQYNNLGQLRFTQEVVAFSMQNTNSYQNHNYTTHYANYRVDLEQYDYTDLGNLRNSHSAAFHIDTWVPVSSIPYSGGFSAPSMYNPNVIIDWSSDVVAATKFWKEGREYDSRGRVIQTISHSSGDEATKITTYFNYREDNSLYSQDVQYHAGDDDYRQLSTFSMYDEVGNVTGSRTETFIWYHFYPQQHGNTNDHWGWLKQDHKSYRTDYRLNHEGYSKQQERLYDSNGALVKTTDFRYGTYGDLVEITVGGGSTRQFVTDREGRLIFKREVDDNGVSLQTNIFSNGQQIASHTNSGGTTNSNYTYGITGAINGSNDLVPGAYLVNSNDSLASIAQAVWGDSSLWYLIADANGINADPNAALTNYSGQTIKIPNVTRVVHSNSTTFKPYNPADTIGDTTPKVAIPPVSNSNSNNQCKQITTIVLIAVVAITVSIVTAGTLAPVLVPALGSTLAPVAAGLVAGVAGSVVSQGLTIAAGYQKEFDWKDVATQAVTGALTAGLAEGVGNAVKDSAKLAKIANTLKDVGLNKAIQGMSNYAIKYAVDSAFEVENRPKMDGNWWGNLLLAGATGYVGGRASKVAGAVLKDVNAGKFLTEIGSNFASSATRSVMNKSANGGKMDWVNVATDTFGNTLGNSIVDGTTPLLQKMEEERQKRKQFANEQKLVFASTNPKIYDHVTDTTSTNDTDDNVTDSATAYAARKIKLSKNWRQEGIADYQRKRAFESANPLENVQSEKNLNPSTHTIEPNDNFTKVAAKYGVSVFRLMAANKGGRPESLQIGQELNIPGANDHLSSEAMNSAKKLYTQDGVRMDGIKAERAQAQLANAIENGVNFVVDKTAGALNAVIDGYKTISPYLPHFDTSPEQELKRSNTVLEDIFENNPSIQKSFDEFADGIDNNVHPFIATRIGAGIAVADVLATDVRDLLVAGYDQLQDPDNSQFLTLNQRKPKTIFDKYPTTEKEITGFIKQTLYTMVFENIERIKEGNSYIDDGHFVKGGWQEGIGTFRLVQNVEAVATGAVAAARASKSLSKSIGKSLNKTLRKLDTPKKMGSLDSPDISKIAREIKTDIINVPSGVGREAWVHPKEIRFSQRTISENNYLQLMEAGEWKWSLDNPLILIERSDGTLISLDNRRLASAQQASNVDKVPVRILADTDKYLDYKTWRTAQEAFDWRANHPATIANGGVVPQSGLIDLPKVLPRTK